VNGSPGRVPHTGCQGATASERSESAVRARSVRKSVLGSFASLPADSLRSLAGAPETPGTPRIPRKDSGNWLNSYYGCMADDQMFLPRFDVSEIRALSARYEYQSDASVQDLVRSVQRAGYMTLEQLRIVGHWKSQRIGHHLVRNADSLVRETTRLAFAADHEELRIGILLTLRGVGMPMASVLLHLFHQDKYPIIDFRALWSLNVPPGTAHDATLWLRYVEACRTLAEQAQVSMRELDRALWQYSKEHLRE